MQRFTDQSNVFGRSAARRSLVCCNCWAASFKDGKPEGAWTFWDDKGEVTKTETYKNGELVK